jgi:putative SOS response-associated peptidase YedK
MGLAYLRPLQSRLYSTDVRTLHPELHGATNPGAVPSYGAGGDPEFPTPVQRLPTDPADTVVTRDGARELVEMRWGLVPYWWNKPLKDLRLATFNARVPRPKPASNRAGDREHFLRLRA